MKSILGVLCFALVVPGLVAARPAAPPQRPAASAAISRVLGGFLSLLLRHWTILPADGGHDLPPPTSPVSLIGS